MDGKKIFIIGGTGSLGHTLTSRYLDKNKLFIYSRGENTQWIMKSEFGNNKNLNFFIGDIRDSKRLEECLIRSKPNIIIIAAALKHIDICEKNITECINTNLEGIRNVVHITTKYILPELETVLFISTDKACAPVNVYGMCKAISERVNIENAEFSSSVKYVNVRYGNVLQSRGSLIPLFKSIGTDPSKNFFTLTDINMTRYFMTLEESVNLIEYAILFGDTGDTVIPKNICSYKIKDIAEYFCVKYLKRLKITGIRPGEKIHETLISFTESLRTIEKDDYYIIKPTFVQVNDPVSFDGGEFNSDLNKKYLDSNIIYEIEK